MSNALEQYRAKPVDELEQYRAKVRQSTPELEFSGKSALAGGGGLVGDALSLIKTVSQAGLGGVLPALASKIPGEVPNTTEQNIQNLGVEPQNLSERFLSRSQSWGGQGALIGGGVGGVAGGPIGALSGGLTGYLGGSAAGALYQGLVEMGMDETAAGILTLLAHPSIAGLKEGGKKAVQGTKNLIKGKPAEELFQKAISSEVPEVSPTLGKAPKEPQGMFETAEAAQTEALAQERKTAPVKPIPKSEASIAGFRRVSPHPEPSPLAGRVRAKSVEEEEQQKALHSVGDLVTPESFNSEAQGGRQAHQFSTRLLKEEKERVSDIYKQFEKQTEGTSGLYTGLAKKLEGYEKDLELVEDRLRTTSEQTALTKIKALLEQTGREESGYREVLDKNMLKTADSLTSTLSYEMPYVTGKDRGKGVLKKVVHDINEAAIQSLDSQGKNTALLKHADAEYGKMARKFFNDEMGAILSRDQLNPEANFRRAVKDEGHFRAIIKALEGDKASQPFVKKLIKELVEDRLAPYLKTPEKIGSKEFKRDFENLRELLPSEFRQTIFDKTLAQKIKEHLEKHAKRKKLPGEELRAELVTPRVQAKSGERKLEALKERQAAHLKTLKEKPEDLIEKFKTRSGIKEARKQLSPEKFKKLGQQKISQILKDGNVRAKPTGEKLYKVLNDEKNHEILVELIGRPEVDALLDIAQKLDKAEVTQKTIGNLLKMALVKGVEVKLAWKALKLLHLIAI